MDAQVEPSRNRRKVMPLAQALAAILTASVTATALAPGAAAQVSPEGREVTVTELLPLPGTAAVEADDINDLGQVVGKSGDLPVLWEDGQPTPLPLAAGRFTMATHINDRGDVVVQYLGYPQGGVPRYGAYVWRDGEVTDLNAAGEDVTVADLNERGQVLLTRTRDGVTTHEIWRNGVSTELQLPPPPEGLSVRLLKLSDRGHVLAEHGERLALFDISIWTPSGGVLVGRAGHVSHLTTGLAKGIGVNRHGHVAGIVGTNVFDLVSWSNGRLWRAGGATQLGLLPADINDHSHVVGVNDQSHAALWKKGRLTDLGTVAGGQTSAAYALNERDQVLGYGVSSEGTHHTYFWTDGHTIDLGPGVGPQSWDDPQYKLNNMGQAIGMAAGRKWVMWTVHNR